MEGKQAADSPSQLYHRLCVLPWAKPAPFWLWCLRGGPTAGDLTGTFQTGHDTAKAMSGAVGTQERPLSLPESGKTGDTRSKQRIQQALNTVALQLLWA